MRRDDRPGEPRDGSRDEAVGQSHDGSAADRATNGGEGDAAGRTVPGVRALDHTADVGLEIHASSFDALLLRAARGMAALVFGNESGHDDVWEPSGSVGPPTPRRSPGAHRGAGRSGRNDGAAAGAPPPTPAEHVVEIEADDAADLLVLWLRELLYRQQVDDFIPTDATFEELDEHHLRAVVRGGPAPAAAVRELKGVTYHGLRAERTSDGWRARVIFDV